MGSERRRLHLSKYHFECLFVRQGEEDGHNNPIPTGQPTSHASINLCSRIISFPLAELPKWKASHHATLLLTTFFPVSPSLPADCLLVLMSSSCNVHTV